MNNNNSYAEFLKAVGNNSTSLQAEKLLNEIYWDLFLQHIHWEQTQTRIMELIDDALDRNDEEAFNLYTQQLIEFTKEQSYELKSK
ncbi:IDEAL domain protein [Sporosarcina sp. P37]|uniref:IDEAL domain-containing protein n=1 Tax=unclassified Sporosarcina TaxID=2647733 RepID=UPI0009BE11D8|nr:MULTISPECIES: IDEAL domain-containing protein [unclassified Sporosarcina]ARD47648.1 IDEAL domain protein [Sporosarcina sp. P33]ARK24177.1 IDEAL domain protein [Sporosarcina sp. P37]PID17404.1 IDEAL domain-containing protein [Sporosarcina sp. P35]